MNSDSNKIQALFEKCLNEYSHEGEFEINGNTVTIFRRCGHEDFDNLDENEMPRWVDGDEAVGAFVNQEEFFGWWPQDKDDLYEVMKEVLEYLLKYKGLNVTLTVKASRYPGDDEKSAERKAKLLDMIKDDLSAEDDQIRKIKFKPGSYDDELSCEIFNYHDFWGLLHTIKKNLDNVDAKIADSDPNKETIENMFKYKYDFL